MGGSSANQPRATGSTSKHKTAKEKKATAGSSLPSDSGKSSTNSSTTEETPTRVAPFLRWVGSKRALIPELLKWVPPTFNRYHEPFLGSGALFFALQPPVAVLSDANTYLTRTFGAVARDVEAVIAALHIYAEVYARDPSEAHRTAVYNHVRAHLHEDMAGPELAAIFIFLNRTNFNGVWRVNASGKYNVPAGKFKKPPTVLREENLRACTKALLNATVVNCDFRSVEERAAPGDFVYFDSPYAPTSETANFTTYTKNAFTDVDQRALRDLALRLKNRGVHVLLSNSDTPLVRGLYTDFEIREIQRTGGINSDPTKRAAVTELLIR